MKKAVARILKQLALFSDENEAELKRRWNALDPKVRSAELIRLRKEVEKLISTQIAKSFEVTGGKIPSKQLARFQERIDEQSLKATKGQTQAKRTDSL